MRSHADSIYSIQKSKIKGEKSMVSLSTNIKEEKKSKSSRFDSEFDSYLQKQCLKTTFNGLEIETFSWYKKVLGLL